MPKNYKIPDDIDEKITVIKNIYNTRYSKYTDIYMKHNGYALDFAIDLLYQILIDEDAIEETSDSVIFSVKIKKKKGKK